MYLFFLNLMFVGCFAKRTPKQKLVGTWACTKLMDSGKTAPNEVSDALRWEVDEEYIIFHLRGTSKKYRYTVNSDTKPWTIDLLDEKTNKVMLSIFSIEGGRLFTCSSEGKFSKKRPTAFESVNGSENDVLMEFKKIQ